MITGRGTRLPKVTKVEDLEKRLADLRIAVAAAVGNQRCLDLFSELQQLSLEARLMFGLSFSSDPSSIPADLKAILEDIQALEDKLRPRLPDENKSLVDTLMKRLKQQQSTSDPAMLGKG